MTKNKTKLMPNIKLVRGLKDSIRVRGRLVRENEKAFVFVICSDNCEKCPTDHFYTFFKGKYWKAEKLIVGQMYELTISINKEYLNPVSIRETYSRTCSSIGFIRGRIKEIKDDKIILTSGIEINNPDNIYDMEFINLNKTRSLLIQVKLINIKTDKVYTNEEGKEYPQYVPALSLVGKQIE